MEKNGFISDCLVTYDLTIRPIWICEAGHLKSLISRKTILKQSKVVLKIYIKTTRNISMKKWRLALLFEKIVLNAL